MDNANKTLYGPGMPLAKRERTFVAAMKELREAKGWTQTDLAREMRDRGFLNFHQPTVQRIEAGERPVRLDEAYGLAHALGERVEQMATSRRFLDERGFRELLFGAVELRSAAVKAIWTSYSAVDDVAGHVTYLLDEGKDADRAHAGLEMIRRILEAADHVYAATDLPTIDQAFEILEGGKSFDDEDDDADPGPDDRARLEKLLARTKIPPRFKRMSIRELGEIFAPTFFEDGDDGEH